MCKITKKFTVPIVGHCFFNPAQPQIIEYCLYARERIREVSKGEGI